jgi:hypothetical protein
MSIHLNVMVKTRVDWRALADSYAKEVDDEIDAIFGVKEVGVRFEPSVLMDPYTEYTLVNNSVVGTVGKDRFDLPLDVVSNFYSCLGEENAHDHIPGLQVALPPSRRQHCVSGQLKLAVDMGLLLDQLNDTDIVDVVGAAGTEGNVGSSYYMMAGIVRQVNLYDPKLIVAHEQEICGTRFCFIPKFFSDFMGQGTVLINDAYDEDEKTPILLNVSPYRLFSVKFRDPTYKRQTKRMIDIGSTDLIDESIVFRTSRGRTTVYLDSTHPHFNLYMKCAVRQSYVYGQVSFTMGEVRLTSYERPFVRYKQRLGTCPACVELDYHGIILDDFRRRIFQNQHVRSVCSFSSVSFPRFNYVNLVTRSMSDHPTVCGTLRNNLDTAYEVVDTIPGKQFKGNAFYRVQGRYLSVGANYKMLDSTVTTLKGLSDISHCDFPIDGPLCEEIPNYKKGGLVAILAHSIVINGEVYLFKTEGQTMEFIPFADSVKPFAFGYFKFDKIHLFGKKRHYLDFYEFEGFLKKKLRISRMS